MNTQSKAPWHLWLIGVLAVLWNLVGAGDFTATVTKFGPYMSQFPDEFLAYWYNMPTWKYITWGIATWGGLVGSVLLLMRKSLAVPIFTASLAGVVITFATSLNDTTAPEGASNIGFSAAIILIAVGLLGYAFYLSRQGVLK